MNVAVDVQEEDLSDAFTDLETIWGHIQNDEYAEVEPLFLDVQGVHAALGKWLSAIQRKHVHAFGVQL